MRKQPEYVRRKLPVSIDMAEKLVLPNAILLGEVSEMLSEGRQVIIMTKGSSMLPFIRGDRDSVLLQKKADPEVGDIALARLPGERYVLHRIWSIDGGNVTLMGDGNLKGKETCSTEDIMGTVLEIIKPDGRKVSTTSKSSLRKARIWRKLLPVRRLILGIYRRLI